MPPQREHASSDHNRVTAGLPGLNSATRFAITESALSRIYQKSLIEEYNRNELAATAPDGSRPTTNWDAQVGIPLTSGQIIKRLQKLNCTLWYEVANSDSTKMGVYHYINGEKRFICGFEQGTSPEFSVRVCDEHGAFKKEIRGWRTLLRKLIRAKFITEAGVFTQFGPPNRDSENWMVQTQ